MTPPGAPFWALRGSILDLPGHRFGPPLEVIFGSYLVTYLPTDLHTHVPTSRELSMPLLTEIKTFDTTSMMAAHDATQPAFIINGNVHVLVHNGICTQNSNGRNFDHTNGRNIDHRIINDATRSIQDAQLVGSLTIAVSLPKPHCPESRTSTHRTSVD